VQIRGERTILRPVTPADLDVLVGWFSDPEVYRWWDGYPKPRDEVAEKYIERQPGVERFIVEAGAQPAEQPAAETGGDAGGRPIGYLQYWHGDGATGGIDMFLTPASRGQGLGPDAARAMVRYLLDTLGWTRVTVDPYANNLRAIRAWGTAGFAFERELPDHPGGPALLMVIEANPRASAVPAGLTAPPSS